LTDIDSKKDIGLSCTRTDANSEPRHSLARTNVGGWLDRFNGSL